MEPTFLTEARLLPVLNELKKREPIFHTPAFGKSRADHEKVTDADYWEVGASGNRYSREYVLDELERCGHIEIDHTWETRDFWCREIAPDNYLLTYTLAQGDRITRRSTIWRRTSQGWQILYHQGTIAQEP
jgi:hypothetical protein